MNAPRSPEQGFPFAIPPRLTPELREFLRQEIDRRRRELLAVEAEISNADYELFAEDRAMFPRGPA
jgi:hypothetical protein